jgi:hypothetical protein
MKCRVLPVGPAIAHERNFDNYAGVFRFRPLLFKFSESAHQGNANLSLELVCTYKVMKYGFGAILERFLLSGWWKRSGNEARGRLRRSVRTDSHRDALHFVLRPMDLESPAGLTARPLSGYAFDGAQGK